MMWNGAWFGMVLSLVCATSATAAERWRPLFDGRTLDGWIPKIVGSPAGEDARHTFVVRDGAITVSYAGYDRFQNRFGHLFYKAPFKAFRLRLKYKVLEPPLPDTPGWARGNSGVMFLSQSPQSMRLDQPFPVSVEFQILGADGPGPRPTGNVCTPGVSITLEGAKQPVHCSTSSGPTIPNGAWVDLELEVSPKGLVTEMINGAVVHTYSDVALDPADPMMAEDARRLIAARGGALPVTEGWIALQSEGHPIAFKDIEILVLK